ncbi:pentapeptide repeat-containing protein [Glycomyces buryatensis]|nr:pentapeptide repeat-containing protein [Glycomyces buryatensis]
MIGSYYWLSEPIPGRVAVTVEGQLSETDQVGAEEAARELELARLRAEARRNALATGAGIAAMCALVLTLRRQQHVEYQQASHEREAERAHEQRERSAEAAQDDALQRRITDGRIRAVDQLGSDNPTVRIGGLHNLERIGQQHPELRQIILDEICSYLRLPYKPLNLPVRDQLPPRQFEPIGPPKAEDEDTEPEHEVRLIAQEILVRHLNPEIEGQFWEHQRLNLKNAHLQTTDFSRCNLRKVDFTGVVFDGDAVFDHSFLSGMSVFENAIFKGHAAFTSATFSDASTFEGVLFQATATFIDADFGRFDVFMENDNSDQHGESFEVVSFKGASFGGDVDFMKANFFGGADFRGTRFSNDTRFLAATFHGDVDFVEAMFSSRATFIGTTFAGSFALFGGVVFAGTVDLRTVTFNGEVDFQAVCFRGEVEIVRNSNETEPLPSVFTIDR